MARNGRPRGAPTEDQIERVRTTYLRTGDLAGSCAEVGVRYDAIEALAEADHWSDERAKVREQRTLDTIADQSELERLKRRANALHRELSEDALISVRRQWRDRWQAEVASMGASEGARVYKTLGEALKSLQFVHRLALGMDTEKVGSEAAEALLVRIREAKQDAARTAAERCADSGAPDGPAPPPTAS